MTRLKWHKNNHAWFTIWTAEIVHPSGFTILSFEVEKCLTTYRLTINGGYEGDFRTLLSAKQYAQAEYERRIK